MRARFLTVREIPNKERWQVRMNPEMLDSNQKYQYQFLLRILAMYVNRYRNKYRCIYIPG